MRKFLAIAVVAMLAIAAGPPATAQHAQRDFMYQQAIDEGADRYVAQGVRTVYHQPAAEQAVFAAPVVVSEKSAGKKKAGDKDQASDSRKSRAAAPSYPLLL